MSSEEDDIESEDEYSSETRSDGDEEDADRDVPLADPDAGRGVRMKDIGDERRGGHADEGEFVELLPEWDPTSRAFGIYPPRPGDLHGTTIVVVGPAGSGKTRVLQTLCMYAWPLVHRAVLLSPTNERSMQFDDLNMFQEDAIIEHPRPRIANDWVRERRGELRIWREKHDAGGVDYVQRSFLHLMDDTGFVAKLLYYRSDEMLELFSNRRHLAWHGWIALQNIMQLGKLLRMQVGIYIITREQLAGGLAALWDVLFRASGISARKFRQMVDEVCLKGRRVLVFIPGEGALFKWTLPAELFPLEYPLGSSAWHQLGRENRLSKRASQMSGRESMMAALRERREEDEAARVKKERARGRGTSTRK
jgi:hypothetical protein